MRFTLAFLMWMSVFSWIRDFPVPLWYTAVMALLLVMDVVEIYVKVRDK